jgi:hypothetical protein
MSELKDTETAVSKLDDKLHKLIKSAKKTARNALAIRRFKTRACSC